MEWQEHEMISWLKDRFSCCLGKVCGIGDDAAYVCGDVVWSVDTCVEHVHFRRQWIAQGIVSWETIGRRAAISALSDIAAMGAKAKRYVECRYISKRLSLRKILNKYTRDMQRHVKKIALCC